MEGVTASEESAGADADLARAEMELIRKVEVLEAFLEQSAPLPILLDVPV